MSQNLFLGVDGGATKTEIALVAGDGTFLTSIFGGPTCLGSRASKRIIENLNNLIDFVCQEAGVNRSDITHAGFGVHGVDYQCELARQRSSLFGPLGLNPETSILKNDGVAALWGGTPKEQAVVLQIGTGFTAAYRAKYGEEVPFDHFNLGVGIYLRDAIYSTAFRVLDGRERPSVLPELVFEHFGIYDLETLIRLWRRERLPMIQVMSIVQVLTKAVDMGDKVAIKLVKERSKKYIHDVITMLQNVGHEKSDVVLGGGVLLNAPQLLRDLIAQGARKKFPETKVHTPLLSPALGGCVMAAHNAGKKPASIFRQIQKTQGK